MARIVEAALFAQGPASINDLAVLPKDDVTDQLRQVTGKLVIERKREFCRPRFAHAEMHGGVEDDEVTEARVVQDVVDAVRVGVIQRVHVTAPPLGR